jgi:hypothetical protein
VPSDESVLAEHGQPYISLNRPERRNASALQMTSTHLRAVTFTGNNRSGGTQLVRWADAVPPVPGRRGRLRRRLRKTDGSLDKTDRSTRRIARRGVAHGFGLGEQRWGGGTVLRLTARLQAPADPL